ncbi:hypothetical protein [Aurantibacillus circumpalustris]|uniref:hypothetical protein n=1 Tax=Aurantibacillus circumpalustris TaxID=3036359 RepID=UPI00295AED32|nr:hypothetical protein [Aurantibacillus circumpalustris]
MKKNIRFLLFSAGMVCLFIFSCKKKETEQPQSNSTTTAGTTTGGTTTGGTTTGGTTTGGTTTGGTTSGSSAFTKVRVTGFQIAELEDLEPPLGWDANDGPDVFYIIYKDETNDKIAINGISDIRNNVVEKNLPLIFTFPSPHVINNLDDYFHLSIYDYDGSTDEFITGSSFRFKGSDYANYPTTVEKNYVKCKLKIYIQWFN